MYGAGNILVSRRGGAAKVLETLRYRRRIASSTADAKGAIGRLDPNLTPVLGARAEPEGAARHLNNRAAGTLVWIIHKLIARSFVPPRWRSHRRERARSGGVRSHASTQ